MTTEVIQLSLIIDDNHNEKLEIELDSDLDSVLNRTANKYSIDTYTLGKLKENLQKQIDSVKREKINKKNEKKKRIDDSVNRLYNNALKKKEDKERRIKDLGSQREQIEAQECTFMPKVNENTNKLRNYSSNTYYNASKRLFNQAKEAKENAEMVRIAREAATRRGTNEIKKTVEQPKATSRSNVRNSSKAVKRIPNSLKNDYNANINQGNHYLQGRSINDSHYKSTKPNRIQTANPKTNLNISENRDLNTSSIENSQFFQGPGRQRSSATKANKKSSTSLVREKQFFNKKKGEIFEKLFNDAKIKEERMRRFRETVNSEFKYEPIISEESNRIIQTKAETRRDRDNRLANSKKIQALKKIVETVPTEAKTTERVRVNTTSIEPAKYNRITTQESKKKEEIQKQLKEKVPSKLNRYEKGKQTESLLAIQNCYISDYFDFCVDNQEKILSAEAELPIPDHIRKMVMVPTLTSLKEAGLSLTFENFYRKFVEYHDKMLE